MPALGAHGRWPVAAWNPEAHGTDNVNLVGKVISDPGRCLASEAKQGLPDGTEPQR